MLVLVVKWMPTFKHHKANNRNDFNQDIKNDVVLLEESRMKKINDYIKMNGVYIIVKLHPAQDIKFIDVFELSNFIFVNNYQLKQIGISSYNLLGMSDALITDFSSVYFDYLLINKPIGFDLSAMSLYESGVGFIFENPLNYMPGDKIYDEKDMLDFIKKIIDNKDDHFNERNDLLNTNHDYKDGNSTKRLADYFGLGKEN